MKRPILGIVLCLTLPIDCQQAAEPATGTRLDYVLLNDVSGSTLWPRGIEQQVNAATQFLKQVVVPGSDIGSLRNFSEVNPNEDFLLDVENSTNPGEIAAKLVHQGRGGTNVGDTVVLAARWLAKQESSDRRKMIFVFSDWDDNASRLFQHYPEDWIAAVRTLHIPIIVIAPSVVEHKRQGKRVKQFAEATGGHAYFIHESDRFDFSLFKRDLPR
jgi:hypothetical protein